ncbi:MAG: flagellar hook-length control protein FliK [Clostridiales bacterium]|nr:flagellar hook-length control protein FliK [Clostridiales bacterium]
MNVNMAQLNSKQVINEAKEKINLSLNGEAEAVDFQTVMASLMGLSLNPEMPSVEMEMPSVDIKSEEVKSLLSELSLKVDNKNMKMLLINESFNLQEAPTDISKLDVLKALMSEVQTELGVKEIAASTEPSEVEFMPQSYQNLLKIKFKEDDSEKGELKVQFKVMEKGISESHLEVEKGETSGKENLSGKAFGLEKALENINKDDKETFKIEDGKLMKVEDPSIKKNEQQPAIETGHPKTITNTKEIREAMIDSLKEVQTEGVSKMKVMLAPKELGQVEIELRMEQGRIKGEIKVMNAEIKNQIEQLIAPIKETLKDQNIQLKDFQVTVFDHGASEHFSQNQNMNSHQNRYQAESLEYQYDEIIPEVTQMMENQGSLNILA